MSFLEYLVYIFKCTLVLFGIFFLFNLIINTIKDNYNKKKYKLIQEKFLKKLIEDIEKNNKKDE